MIFSNKGHQALTTQEFEPIKVLQLHYIACLIAYLSITIFEFRKIVEYFTHISVFLTG
jgi:hypothetical protein